MADLATIANVKALLGLTGVAEDALLTRIVSAVSARMQREIGRTFAVVAYTDTLDSIGISAVRLREYPVVSIASVTENGVALASTDYAVENATGLLYRMSGASVIQWEPGLRAIVVTYLAGYATVPADVEDACIQQSAYEWRKSKTGGDRLGVASSTLGPGTASYVVDAWAPGVFAVVRAYRRVL